MYPVIYDFGDISIFGFSFHPVINSYGFMLMVAFYSCYYFLNKDLKRLGYNPSLAGDIVFAAAVGGIIGSRIYFLLEWWLHIKKQLIIMQSEKCQKEILRRRLQKYQTTLQMIC